MSMAREIVRKTLTTGPLYICSQPPISCPPLPLFYSCLSLLPQEPFSDILTRSAPSMCVFCKSFTVRRLYFSVSFSEYYEPHCFIPIKTEVMSVLHSHCFPSVPGLLQRMNHRRSLRNTHWINGYGWVCGEVVVWRGERFIFEIMNPIKCQRCIPSFNPQKQFVELSVFHFILKMEKLMSRDVNHLFLWTQL